MAHTRNDAEKPAGLGRHLLSIALLPFMNTVVIPAALFMTIGQDATFAPANPVAALFDSVGVVAGLAGLGLVAGSIALFARRGNGTLAPWDPPRNLVVSGLYRYCRNPMKLGLFLVLASESLLLHSTVLAFWMMAFAAANTIYIRLSEEPALLRRFGSSYAEYCKEVPRWLPVPGRSRRAGIGGAAGR